MSDPFNDSVGRGDLESTVDTGGVNPGQIADSSMTGTRNMGAGGRQGLPTDADFEQQMEETSQLFEDRGVQREQYASIEELQQAQLDERQRMAEEDAYEEEQARLRAEEEAAKDAAREEAHANGEAFYEGDVRYNGEDCQEWTLPDGTTIIVNAEGEAVSVEWPPGEGPSYVGDVIVGGEPCSVWELPTGAQIVVDADGQTIGTLDDVDVDDMTVDLFLLTGDHDDIGTMVTVEVVPGENYDTQYVDAETGEVYDTKFDDTGSTTSGMEIYFETGGDVDPLGDYSLYNPPGTDYYIVIDEDGMPVDTIPVPQEPEWSVLGIVEYYGDGEVVVDLGATEISVDVVGPDGGISVDFDVLVAEGTAGVEWHEDGSWEFETSVDVDAGIAEIELDAGFGQDAAGNWHVDVETWMEMQTGGLNLEGGQHFHFQQTDEGFEVNVGWEGKVSTFGFYVERAQDFTAVVDEDGTTLTYQDMVGAGHELLGGVQTTWENQIRVSEDGEVGATTGVYGRIVDSDGDEVIGGGTYLDSEAGGPMSRSEQLDTGRDYERQYGDDRPVGPDVDDDAAMGAGDVDRFGLGDGGSHEPAFAGTAEALPMNVEIGMAARIARRSTGDQGEEAPEPPAAVAEAMAGRYAEVGGSARHLLASAPGGERYTDDQVVWDSVRDDPAGPDVARGPLGDRLGNFEIQDVVSEGPQGDGVWLNDWVNNATDGPPGGAQLASNQPPPPSEEPPAEEPPAERPRIFQRRDGDATTPEDEPPAEPAPTPRPRDEWPKIAEERLMDADEDGDGVPDRFGPDGPIMGDGDDLGDVVSGPAARRTAGARTADAGVEQSGGRIDRPDVDQRFASTADGSPNVDRIASGDDGSSATASGPAEFIGETEKNLQPEGESVRSGFMSAEGGVDPTVVEAGDRAAGLMSAEGGVDPTVAQPGERGYFVDAVRTFTDRADAPAAGLRDPLDEVADVPDGEATGVWTDMRPMGAADTGESATEPAPLDLDDVTRPDASGVVMSGGTTMFHGGDGPSDEVTALDVDRDLELADDIAPPATVLSGGTTMVRDVGMIDDGVEPEPDAVAEVETAIPAFRPEIGDEVVIGVADLGSPGDTPEPLLDRDVLADADLPDDGLPDDDGDGVGV